MRQTRMSGQTTLDFNPISEHTQQFFDGLEEAASAISRKTLALVQVDLQLSASINPETGRPGMSAEQAARVGLLMQMFQYSYRTLHERLEDSILMRRFAGYEFVYVPCFKTLQNNIKAISESTWESLNRDLVRFGVAQGVDSHDSLRIDTTAVESNIHHPTDASLLYDGIRLLVRNMKKTQKLFAVEFRLHNRTKAAKKLSFKIHNTTTNREGNYSRLVQYAQETVKYASEAIKALRAHRPNKDIAVAASAIADVIEEHHSLTKQVISQTRRRVFEDKKVPAEEKVVSLFEPHTDIIQKGGRETVFGHKVCLTAGNKLIHDAIIAEGNPADPTFFQDALRRHHEAYRTVPGQVAVDGGFSSTDNIEKAHAMGIKDLFFPKRVSKVVQDFIASGKTAKLLARFRAGVEGIISGAKRGARMSRVLWRGLESFHSYVWASICAYNLRAIATAITAT